MKNRTSLVLAITNMNDINKITKHTKYINLDIANISHDIITYFVNNGKEFLYSDIVEGVDGYNYVSYDEFVKAENLIDMMYANMPNNLNKLETAKYLYISIAKCVSFDINCDSLKNEVYNLSLVSNANNLWGSLATGKVTDKSTSKIFYYLCKRLDIDISIIFDEETNNIMNKLKINNQILIVDLFKDIPYIQCMMQTKYFATYNDDIDLDKKIGYLKSRYTDYYLDKSLKDIDYTKEDCVSTLLSKTESLINIENIKPSELSVIYNYIFDKYCPNYNIKINNLFLNDVAKNHFIMISYNDTHYSFNYKQNTFVKVTDDDITYNLNIGKISLYLNEYIPNINNI